MTVEAILDRLLPGLPPGARLNVGAGTDARAGFVNLDLAAVKGVDVVASVAGATLPFPDGAFSLVLCRDVLEHVEVVDALREIHRVLVPGGAVVVSAVHFTSRDLYVDPTHVRGFSSRTFDFFASEGGCHGRGYYFDFAFQAVEQLSVQFHTTLGNGRWLVWDRLVEPLVNRRRSGQDVWEMTVLSRLFPAANVLAVLRR